MWSVSLYFDAVTKVMANLRNVGSICLEHFVAKDLFQCARQHASMMNHETCIN